MYLYVPHDCLIAVLGDVGREIEERGARLMEAFRAGDRAGLRRHLVVPEVRLGSWRMVKFCTEAFASGSPEAADVVQVFLADTWSTWDSGWRRVLSLRVADQSGDLDFVRRSPLGRGLRRFAWRTPAAGTGAVLKRLQQRSQASLFWRSPRVEASTQTEPEPGPEWWAPVGRMCILL